MELQSLDLKLKKSKSLFKRAVVQVEAGTWLFLLFLAKALAFIGKVINFVVIILFIMPEALLLKLAEKAVFKIVEELKDDK